MARGASNQDIAELKNENYVECQCGGIVSYYDCSIALKDGNKKKEICPLHTLWFLEVAGKNIPNSLARKGFYKWHLREDHDPIHGTFLKK